MSEDNLYGPYSSHGDADRGVNQISSQPGIDKRKEAARQKSLTPEQKDAEELKKTVSDLQKRLTSLENQIVEVHGLGAHMTAGTLKGGVHLNLPSSATATCTGDNTLQLTFF